MEGKKLKIGDVTHSSDPFLKFSSPGVIKKFETEVKKQTLNPVWDEEVRNICIYVDVDMWICMCGYIFLWDVFFLFWFGLVCFGLFCCLFFFLLLFRLKFHLKMIFLLR